LNDKDIRRWHHANGMEYIKEDWGPRDPETGEGLSPTPYWGDNAFGRESRPGMSMSMTPGRLDWLDAEGIIRPLWAERSPEDRAVMESLEDFFTPYIATLPRPKGNLLREYMGMRRTQADIAREESRTQQAVSAALVRAMRDLLRAIAKDDPDWTPPKDGRRRDYAGEREAAERVFDRYWKDRTR
jgi:hypothetical protein